MTDLPYWVIITLPTLLGKDLSYCVNQLLLKNHVYAPTPLLTTHLLTREALDQPLAVLPPFLLPVHIHNHIQFPFQKAAS